MSEQKDRRNRATILLVGVIFLSLWVLINAGEFFTAGLIYVLMPVVSIFLYRQWEYFGRKGKLIGIDKYWGRKYLYGILTGIGLILFGEFTSIGSIGIPNVQSVASVVGKFLIIVGIAGPSEELLFRDLMMDFFDEKFLDMPYFLAAIIINVLFAFYHLSAYGGSISATSASFYTAFLAGMLFSYERKWFNSNATNIATHQTLNFWIGYVKLAVVFG